MESYGFINLQMHEMKKGDDSMVPWWGLPIALVFGVAVGIVLIAIISANDEEE